MRLIPSYVVRRLHNEEAVGNGTVFWDGEEITIAEALRRARELPEDTMVPVTPMRPTAGTPASFSISKV